MGLLYLFTKRIITATPKHVTADPGGRAVQRSKSVVA